MKKISLIVMSCMIACGLLANHGIVKGGEMSPKVEDTVSIDKKIADSQWLSNNSDTLEVDTAGEDSVVNVVAYFCKGDTCEYWIYENEWKVNGKDTVKTLGVSTQVRLVVNDSTSKGYKMSYTFLDVKADSVGDNFRDKMMAMVAERTAKSVIGTTINFETDEYGRITKITNLSKIKKQAKALFKASMKDIAAMPIMQAMKKAIGLDFMKIGNQANTDELVEGYLEELKLLFACHGSQYAVGEHHEHEDATKDSYANDTYINASLEKNGNYTISCEVVSVIPKETVKEVMGGLMGAITEGLKGKKTEDGKDHDGIINDLDDEFKKEIDKAVDQDAQTSEYLCVTCFEDGWPWIGDYDMNDVVVVVSVDRRSDKETGKVDLIRINWELKAAGAAHLNAFAVQLDKVRASEVAGVETTNTTFGRGAFAGPGPESGSELAVIPLFNTSQEILGEGTYINTTKGVAVPTVKHTTTVTFAQPVDPAAVRESALNAFIVVNQKSSGTFTREKEIHMPGRMPTQFAVVSGNTFLESDPYRYFVTKGDGVKNNYMMWALCIPGEFRYPLERSDIRDVYTYFNAWAASGGREHVDWYQDDADEALLY